MRAQYLLIIISVFLLSSCENLSVQKELSTVEKELIDLNISTKNYARIDSSYYKNGIIKSLEFYNTEKNYLIISFYESGFRKSITKVENGQVNGESFYWYENGNVQLQQKYKNGDQIGPSISYYESGNRKEYVSDSSYILYYKNGNQLMEFILKMNSDDEFIKNFYNENGSLVFSGTFHNKKMFQKGTPFNGEIKCFFDNKKPALYYNYENGGLQGNFFYCHGNGAIKFEGNYLKNKEVFSKAYNENGQIEMEYDSKSNITKYWSEDGTL